MLLVDTLPLFTLTLRHPSADYPQFRQSLPVVHITMCYLPTTYSHSNTLWCPLICLCVYTSNFTYETLLCSYTEPSKCVDTCAVHIYIHVSALSVYMYSSMYAYHVCVHVLFQCAVCVQCVCVSWAPVCVVLGTKFRALSMLGSNLPHSQPFIFHCTSTGSTSFSTQLPSHTRRCGQEH